MKSILPSLFLITSLFFLSAGFPCLNAQDGSRFKFGGQVGYSHEIAAVSLKESSSIDDRFTGVQPQNQVGLANGAAGGLIIMYRIKEGSYLRTIPGVSVASNFLVFSEANGGQSQVEVDGGYFDLPIQGYFHVTQGKNGNPRLALFGGGRYLYKFTGKSGTANQLTGLSLHDFAIEGGIGLDIKNSTWHLIPEIRYSLGLINQSTAGSGYYSGGLQTFYRSRIYFSIGTLFGR